MWIGIILFICGLVSLIVALIIECLTLAWVGFIVGIIGITMAFIIKVVKMERQIKKGEEKINVLREKLKTLIDQTKKD